MVIRVRGIEIDKSRWAVRHAGAEWSGLSPVRWRLVISLILGGGLTAEELADLVWGHLPNGGGNTDTTMRVMVHKAHMKAIVAGMGLKIYATRSGEPRTRYEMIPAYMERGSR